MKIKLYYNSKTVQDATWDDLCNALEALKEEAQVILRPIPVPENGPTRFDIEGENGYFFPGILEADGEIRQYIDLDAVGKDPIEIGGYNYSAMMVTQDYDLIVRMVKEFYETGNVSRDLLK